MVFSGIYRHKLHKILTLAGLIVILLMTCMAGLFLIRQSRESYIHYLSDSTQALETSSGITMTIISRAIHDAMRSPQLTRWAETPDENLYYYYAIDGIHQLQVITTDTSLIDYDMAALTTRPRNFPERTASTVLRKTGSSASDDFFLEKGLAHQEVEAIDTHFTQSNMPVVLPRYDEAQNLTDIYYIVKAARRDSQLLLFLTIPAKTLIGSSGAEGYFLFDDDNILAYSSANPASAAHMTRIAEQIQSESNSQRRYYKENGNYIFLSSIPATGWKIAYVYDNFVPGFSQIALFFLAICLSSVLLLFLLSQLAESLYRPIGEVVSESLTEAGKEGGPIDEFEIIRQNSEKIRTLNQSLREVIDENNVFASKQQLRSLLFSPAATAGKDVLGSGLEEKDYYVALVEFHHITDDYLPGSIMILKEYVHEFSLTCSIMTYVDVDHIRLALIIKTHDEDEAKSLLCGMLHDLNQHMEADEVNQWIALSSPKRGANHLCLAYQEALRVLEYKHLYHQTCILTYNQIKQVDAVTYSYPLATENKLVHGVLEGNQEALDLFDQLIRTNLLQKTLSIESIRSFVYSLIGTVGRIFQELKSSPESFLNREIDFQNLYEHWSDSVTITQLRQAVFDTLEAVKLRQARRDQDLLTGMRDFIHENFADDIMLNDLADHFNISPKYCGILFKQLSGQNFKDYLNRYRVEKAMEYLRQSPGMKISDLSLLVGFNSSNSFIRVFGKYTGVTPKAYSETCFKALPQNDTPTGD